MIPALTPAIDGFAGLSAAGRAGLRPWLILGLLAAGGCGESGERVSTGAEPRRGGTAVVVAASDLQVSNPLSVTESWTRDLMTSAVFLPLVRAGAEEGYEPALAESWEREGDTAVVFHLRRDVRWHDGRRTTASDVAFTFDRAMDPATGFPNPGYFSAWSEAEVVDSFTVRFHVEPQSDRLMGWSRTGIVPRHLLEAIPAAQLARSEFNLAPVGNGPFRFVSRRANDHWTFEANPEFPEGLGGRPLLDRLIWRVVPESDAQLTELLTGRADLMTGPRADDLDRIASREEVRALVRPTRRYTFIGWNGRHGVLANARVRRALAMALDRRRMLEATRGGYGTLASTPIPPSHFAHDPALATLPYDTVGARRLLEESGIVDRDGDGLRETQTGDDIVIELKIPANNAFNRDVAELVRSDLARVGVRVTLRPTEPATLIADITSPERRFEAVVMALEADPRLDLRPLFHSDAMGAPFQIAGYSDPEVDRLLDRVAAAAERGEARGAWRRLQRRLYEDQPWTVLWFSPDLFLAQEELRGVEMDERGAFLTIDRWWLAPTGS